MNIFQIGAAGSVGRRLGALLVARGDAVSGMHRAPAQSAQLEASGVSPVSGDLVEDSVAELAAKMAGHDAVVFTAGAHGTGRDMTTAIDGLGLRKAADAAADAGVSRFVLVSVFPDAERGGVPDEGFEHYIRTKKSADAHLAGTDLDWVIVRPGALRDVPGAGTFSAGPALEYADVSRDDLAAFIAALLGAPSISRTVIELTSGPTPITRVVADLEVRATAAPPGLPRVTPARRPATRKDPS